MYNGFDLYSSSGKSNHENRKIEGVECSVSDRICNFLIYVKSEGKIHLVPVSRKHNIETLIFVFQTWIQWNGNPSGETGAREAAFCGPGLLVLTDACNNCVRQKRYDKYYPKEHCFKGKLAAHLSQNHILSANKYSFLQLINLKFVWFGFSFA